MDGLLVIDKPAGPTSHDVVARIRRVLGERRVGHTGTLDPAATGILPLVLGRATRLARFLSAADKSYDAELRLGVVTDTHDAEGAARGAAHAGPWPSREEVARALDAFRGTYLQQPPTFSAKKIGGRRSYKLARAALVPGTVSGTVPGTVPVTVHRLDLLDARADCVRLRLDCSAGFYVRALARDLGDRLGVGAHLTALRRTRSGDLTVADALPLDAAERDPDSARARVVPLDRMLPTLAAVVLTEQGTRRAAHGRDLGHGDMASGEWTGTAAGRAPARFRLLDPAGRLVGIGETQEACGLLHPSVVLV